MNNIVKVLEKKLCINCSSCAEVCPENCIKMIYKHGNYYPEVNGCINCGLCTKVCPSINNSYDPSIITNETLYEDILLRSYIAWNNNHNIRFNSTSGGLVTQLLLNLFDEKFVDYIFGVKSDGINNKVKYQLLTSKEDILSSSKSKYINPDMQDLLKHIKEYPDSKYAIVLLPCHIQAILNYIKLYKLNRENFYLIGLICGRTMNYNFIRYIEKVHLKKQKLVNIDYTSKEKNGYHADIKCITDGETVFLGQNIRKNVRDFFSNDRCIACGEKLNVMSDISFGDILSLPKIYTRDGESCVLVWSNRGAKLFDLVKSNIEIYDKMVNLLRIHNIPGIVTKTKYGIILDLYKLPNIILDKKLGRRLKAKMKIAKLGKRKKYFNFVYMYSHLLILKKSVYAKVSKRIHSAK